MKACGIRAFIVVGAALAGVACGGPQELGADEGPAIGASEEALAPAGTDARVVASAIPSVMFPGERRFVSVTTRNTGAAAWTTAAPPYALASQNASFNWFYAYVPQAVPVGSEQRFDFVLTAPPATATFQARMSAVGLGPFGEAVTVPVTVDPNATPQWGCTFVSSTLPAQLAPGETRYVTVTVRNTGSSTWAASGFKLASRDTPVNLWGTTNADLTAAVAPGGTATFGFNLRAPAAAGTYAFQRDMKDYTGIGDFRTWNLCVTQSIVVGGTAPLSASVVSQNFATTLRPAQGQSVQVVMKNAGSEVWAGDGSYALYSLNTPVNVWGQTIAPLRTATVNGQNATFPLWVVAPSAPGTYHQKWQMRKISGQGAGFFGEIIDVPVTVPSLSQLDAAFVSQNCPTELTIGERAQCQVTVQNSGAEAWSAFGPYSLAWSDSSQPPWGSNSTVRTSVTGGASTTLDLFIRAPDQPGTYHQKWQMRKDDGTGNGTFFGTVVDIPVTVKLPDGAVALDAVVGGDFPSTAIAGSPITVNVTVRNTGFETWKGAGVFELASLNSPADLFGPTSVPLNAGAVYNDVIGLTLNLTAPTTPGTYHQKWQMRKTSGPGAGVFGGVTDVLITVTNISNGNHRLTVHTGTCALPGADVWLYQHPSNDPFDPFGPLRLTCPNDTTCTYEVFDGEEFELHCYQPGHTFLDENVSISPSPSPSTCFTSFDSGPRIVCDVFGTSQDFEVNLGWTAPCTDEFCF